jgi:hypothetical protein
MTERALCLTFDIDWAPDFVVDEVADMCIRRRVRATWFATHQSPAIARLAQHGDLFELGMHPNFMAGSTHGRTYDEVLAHCRALVPDAISVRTHGVYQSGPLLAQIVAQTKIRVDSSILLPEMPHIRAVRVPTDAGWLTRVPCFWADDYQLLKGADESVPDAFRSLPGVQVYVFHPIHIYLNSASPQHYREMRARTPNLSEAAESHLRSFVNTSANSGIRSILSRLMRDVSGNADLRLCARCRLLSAKVRKPPRIRPP